MGWNKSQAVLFGFLGFLFLTQVGCSHQDSAQQVLLKSVMDLPKDSWVRVLLVTDQSTEETLQSARSSSVEVSGDAVLIIEGEADRVGEVLIPGSEGTVAILDEDVRAEKSAEIGAPDERIYYLAKKEFGLPEYWSQYPFHDGRGVLAGVIDDGVSVLADGFRTTSDGQRKFVLKHTTSELLRLSLVWNEDEALWKGVLNEATLKPVNPSRFVKDLNGDGEISELAIQVQKTERAHRVCIDLQVDQVLTDQECFHTFQATGEYGYWTQDQLVSVTAEFDEAKGILTLTQGERGDDHHGEGVASVLLGHRLAGRFDGVAPGAKLADYDFSEADSVRQIYTIGDFVRALDWMGSHGVNVVNVSYSLFFTSAQAQIFMNKAIAALIRKHNMVVSWSAGNNGPGLGSLQRSAIYPSDALVAGAFVSRELNEYVHGVTGLPPEGRVVWYSSRGPGPHGGPAPVVISPLASLVHATPTGGFRAFSGTSSAAPALAGLAAVLISIAKQENWPVDASAVVHAIRMSAEPLPQVAFIEQGYGIPNIFRAKAIYQKLIQKELFSHVVSEVRTMPAIDGVSAQGVYLGSHELNLSEHVVRLQGHLPARTPPGAASALLHTVRLHYSVSWLSGAERLWVSASPSQFAFQLDVEQVLASLKPGGELTGEIEVREEKSGLRLSVIPVTIYDGSRLTAKLHHRLALGSDEGRRIHFRLPPGAQGFRVAGRESSGEARRVFVMAYDSSRKPISEPASLVAADEHIISVAGAGHHQLGVFRVGGTSLASEVEIEIEPIWLELSSRMLDVSKPEVTIANHGGELRGWLQLEELPTQVFKGPFSLTKSTRAALFEITDLKPGTYKVNFERAQPSDVDYSYLNCLIEELLEGGGVGETIRYLEYDHKADSKVKALSFSCQSFDQLEEDMFSVSVLVSVNHEPPKLKRYGHSPIRLRPGLNRHKIELSEAIPRPNLGVFYQSAFGQGRIYLGELIVLQDK